MMLKAKKRSSQGEKDEEKPKKKVKHVEDVPPSQKAPIPSSDSVRRAQTERKEKKEAVSKGKTETLPAEPLSKKKKSPKNEKPLKAEETKRQTALVDASTESKDDSEKVQKPKQARSAVTKAEKIPMSDKKRKNGL